MDLRCLNYLFVCDKVDNLGDLSCGFKVIHDLHEQVGVPLSKIFVVSNDPESCQIFNKYQLNIEKSKLKKVQQIIAESNINIQIATSTDCSSAKHKFTGMAPVLALCEYDFTSQKPTNYMVCKSLGLGKDSIGILIDHPLNEWGFSDEAKDPLKRLSQLQNGSMNLQNAILGKKSIEDFAKTSCLYVSYARPFVLSEYVKNIVMENKKENKKLVFVLPGISFKDLENLKLNSHGIGSIKIVNGKNEVTKHQLGKGKKLKIISGKVKHDDMRTLFKAARPQVVITGDQSLSEAISANLNFVYPEAHHKAKLARNLEKFGYSTFEYENGPFQIPPIPTDLTKNNRLVCSKYDYLPNFEEAIRETFFLKFEKAEAIKDIFEIEMDRAYIISMEQICQLEIGNETRRSKLPQFSDSIFEFTSLGNARYWIKRNKLL